MTRIVVLTKVPLPGRVKTRLIPALGAEGAAALHRAMARDVAAAALGHGVPVQFWVDGPAEHPWSAGLPGPVHAQPGGDLGDRLAAAMTPGPALALGTDSPTLPRSLVRQALDALSEPGPALVLGPAGDGGCWAIGWTVADRAVFQGIPWSTPAVHEALRAAGRRLGWSVRELPPWHDVDTPEDLARLRDELAGLPPDRAPATRRLLERWPCPS